VQFRAPFNKRSRVQELRVVGDVLDSLYWLEVHDQKASQQATENGRLN